MAFSKSPNTLSESISQRVRYWLLTHRHRVRVWPIFRYSVLSGPSLLSWPSLSHHRSLNHYQYSILLVAVRTDYTVTVCQNSNIDASVAQLTADRWLTAGWQYRQIASADSRRVRRPALVCWIRIQTIKWRPPRDDCRTIFLQNGLATNNMNCRHIANMASPQCRRFIDL